MRLSITILGLLVSVRVMVLGLARVRAMRRFVWARQDVTMVVSVCLLLMINIPAGRVFLSPTLVSTVVICRVSASRAGSLGGLRRDSEMTLAEWRGNVGTSS